MRLGCGGDGVNELYFQNFRYRVRVAMNFRPLCDTWILARPKVKYYGAYPSGFLERARSLLGVTIDEPVLHVCSGKVREYPFRGLGPNDCTLDVDASLKPDFWRDLTRDTIPDQDGCNKGCVPWPAILTDPPYTDADAKHYGEAPCPRSTPLLKLCLDAVRPGGRVGMLHYEWPRPPKNARSVAVVGVLVGFANRIRCFSVFEREA